MKKILFCFALSTIFLACSRSKPHPIGGGFSVTCICHTDTLRNSYPLGNKYSPYDSGNKINPYYGDSCSYFKTRDNWDSCAAAVLML